MPVHACCLGWQEVGTSLHKRLGDDVGIPDGLFCVKWIEPLRAPVITSHVLQALLACCLAPPPLAQRCCLAILRTGALRSDERLQIPIPHASGLHELSGVYLPLRHFQQGVLIKVCYSMKGRGICTSEGKSSP